MLAFSCLSLLPASVRRWYCPPVPKTIPSRNTLRGAQRCASEMIPHPIKVTGKSAVTLPEVTLVVSDAQNSFSHTLLLR